MPLQKLAQFISLTSLSLLSLPAIAAPVLTPPPVAAPRSPAQSTPASPTTKLLDDRVKGIMERQRIPGMAVVVIKNGQVQELKGYGVADITTKQPVTPDTKFAIGSTTKPFTAMAIMMLVEEGKVNLDAPVSQYLTDLPAQWQPLTIRQLLSHTAGLYEDYDWRKIKQPIDFIKMGKPELDFPPGEAWSYSNTGFLLAGMVIEKVSSQSYSDFLRDRIFTPLGMSQTQAKLEAAPNLASGYVGTDRLTLVDVTKDPVAPVVYAAGNIVSTARDMAKWVQALNQGKLLNTKSYQQLWTAATLKNGRSVDYGLGWFLRQLNGHPYIEHGGNVAGYAAGLARYPNDQLDIIVLTNNFSASGQMIIGEIASIYAPALSLSRLSPKPDPDPKFTQEFLSLLRGKKHSLTIAPELQLSLKTKRGQFLQDYLKSLRKVEKLEFLQQESKDSDRVYYYNASLKGKPIYVIVTVTAKGEIAKYGAIEQQ
jgi:D-alanyl-D-alanine carboxypeptidase